MIENIRLSFQGIWSHKMRSFLTMLGIIIGIASIISIVSTIKGTNEQIKKNLIGSGTNTVQIQLYQGDYPYEILYNGLPAGIPVCTEETLQSIRDVENVEDAALYTSRTDYNSGVYYGNNGITGAQILAWTTVTFDERPGSEGRAQLRRQRFHRVPLGRDHRHRHGGLSV